MPVITAGHELKTSDFTTSNPQQADVTATESTTSTTYTALTTAGPAVTVTLTAGQKVEIIISATIFGSGVGIGGYAGFAVSGAATAAATDVDAVKAFGSAASDVNTPSRATIYTAGAAGDYTFTMQYRTPSGTTSFYHRRIIASPK